MESIWKSNDREIVVGTILFMRIVVRLLAIGFFLSGLQLVFWDYNLATVIVGLVISVPVSAFTWNMFSVPRRVVFDEIPGYLTLVTYSFWAYLVGPWRFLQHKRHISLYDAVRGSETKEDAVFVRDGDVYSAGRTHKLSIPSGDGNSVVLYSGRDPEPVRFIRSRISRAYAH